MWYRLDWIEDRNLSQGIQEIRFNNILSKEVKILQDCRINKYDTLRKADQKLPAPHYEFPADTDIRWSNGSRFVKLY